MKRLPTPTKDIFQEDISINNNENVLTEKNHIPGNNNQFSLNRRDNLSKITTEIRINKSRISDLTVVYHQKLLRRN